MMRTLAERMPTGVRAQAKVPRWEWRMFVPQHRPGPYVGTGSTSGVVSPEIYIVACGSPHNVKIRADRLQIKRLERLERVDAVALELWRPILDAPFPLSRAQWLALSDVLDLPRPGASAMDHAATLLAAIEAADGPVRLIVVTKRRTPITSSCYLGEHVTLSAGGTLWYSLAFEDEHPSTVASIVRHFGLHDQVNTSYPTLLKGLVGCPELHASSHRSSPMFPEAV